MSGMFRRALPVVTVGLGLVLLRPLPALAVDAVTGISPAYGPSGTTVTVTGQNMSDATSVSFNGVSVAPSSVAPDGTSVTAVVPAGATTGVVTVNGVGGPTYTVSQPTTLALTGPAGVTFPTRAALVAHLTRADGTGVGGQYVDLYSRPRGATDFTLVFRGTTVADGGVTLRHAPAALTTYVARFAGTPAWLAAESGEVTLQVTPRLTFGVPPLPAMLTPTTVGGYLGPASSGATVVLQRYYSGAWHSERAARTDARGRYAWLLTWPRKGAFTYRATRAADASHLAVVSPAVTTTVVDRDLRPGTSGPDVLALQRKLASLHYDVGALNGYFGYDTSHAVVAFQKINKLARDGIAGTTVRARLGHPVGPRMLHPLAGKAMEIDLTRQVVLVAENGAVTRILDSSTGSGRWFTEPDGTRQIANTPLGHWSVVRKVDALVHAPLGELYRPAYFNWDGYAVHGNGSVPPYPASHGCVRITNSAMDRLFSWITLGTSVWVYRT